MDVTDSVGDQIHDLFRCIDHSCLLHTSGIIAEAVHHDAETLGDRGSGQSYTALDLGGTGDGHDTGHNRHFDSDLPDPVQEAVHGGIVKKHLCCEEIASRIDLFFQMADVIGLALTLHMSFGIACADDAEVCVDRLDII